MINTLKKLCISLGIILISIGIIIIGSKEFNVMLDSFNSDIEKSRVIVKTVNVDYNSFNKVIDLYKNDVINFSNTLDFYYDEFPQKNVIILESIGNIKKRLLDVIPVAERMIDNCKYELNNNIMIQQCNNFSTNFKSMVDVYSSTVEKYNSIVVKYNEFAVLNGKTTFPLYENSRNDEFYILYDKF